MDLFDRKLQEDYANRAAATAAAQARADEAARYAVAQRVHEQELEAQVERARRHQRALEEEHEKEINQLTRSYEEELVHANNIFQSFENLLNQVPGIASQRRAMEAFNERARFVIQTGNALLLYVTARYCALREAVIAAFCPDPEFTTQAQKDACTAFFQRFEARFDRYLKERGLFQDGVKELQNFSQEYGIDASLLVPEEDAVLHQAFERFDHRADTAYRTRRSPREAKPVNYVKVWEKGTAQAPKADAILERLERQRGHTLFDVTLERVNERYKTRPWEPWYDEIAPGHVRPDWWDKKELDAEQKKVEKDIRAWPLRRLQIMRAMTSGLVPCRILVHHLDDPLRPGADMESMPPFSEKWPIRHILPMSFGWDDDKAWIGIVNLHLEQYLWGYNSHSNATWDEDGIQGMRKMHEALYGNMTVEPESGMTYHDLYGKFRNLAWNIHELRENCFYERLVSPVLSQCINPYSFNNDMDKEPDFQTFYENKKKEFLFLNKQKGLHDYHSPKSGLIDRIFRGDGKKDNVEPSWEEKQREKKRAEAYANVSLAAYAWEHCSVERVTNYMREVFGDDITNKYLKEYDINAVLEEYRTKNPYWLSSFAVCRYATDGKGAIIFDEQGQPKENPILRIYQHFEEKEKTIWESPMENTTTDEESVTQTYCPSAG